MVAVPAARILIVWLGTVPNISATRLSELVKVTGNPELATAVGEKSKSPTDLSGIGVNEIV
jgi:hypothetical protein